MQQAWQINLANGSRGMKKLIICICVALWGAGLRAGTLPQKTWIELHVIPIVEVTSPESCKGVSTQVEKLKSEWYVLLGKNKDNTTGWWTSWPEDVNWDALVAPKRAVQPTQIFGVSTVKSALDRSTDIFMKTVFNALETVTQNNAMLWTQSLYSRKDYMYYYQPSYVIPPTFVDENNRCYVFVKVLGKKTDDWLNKGAGKGGGLRSFFVSRMWSNRYKSEFKWIPWAKLANANIPEKEATISVEGMAVNRSLVSAIQNHGTYALTELLKLDSQYQKNFDRQRVQRYETDLNEQLSKQAGQSWFTFERAIYFNDKTPQYGPFGLYDTEIPVVVQNDRYATLQDLRTSQLATESVVGIKQEEDLDVVYKGLVEKVMKHDPLKKALQDTEGLPLIYASKQDRLYGIGADGRGQNHLGRMLMTIRQDVDNPPQKYNLKAPDFTLAALKNVNAQLPLWQSTYHMLLYRATGRLPLLKKESKTEKAGSTQFTSGEEEGEHEFEQGMEKSGIRRRLIKPEQKPQVGKAQEVKQSVLPVLTEEEIKEQKSIQAMKERLLRDVTSPKPESEEGAGVGLEKKQ